MFLDWLSGACTCRGTSRSAASMCRSNIARIFSLQRESSQRRPLTSRPVKTSASLIYHTTVCILNSYVI